MTIISIEAKCAKCGVTVAITDIRSNGISFVMKPGESLSLLCPVIIDRKGKNRADDPEECPNLQDAIDERVDRFRREA